MKPDLLIKEASVFPIDRNDFDVEFSSTLSV